MSKVTVEPQYLPETSIEGKYNVRYRLATEDRNQSSAWSNIRTLTLPQKAVQVGTSTTGLIMSSFSVRNNVLLSSTTPDNDVIALAGPARPIVTAVAMHVLPNDSNIPDASPIQNIA